MNYNALNQQLASILQGFDLNQPLGGCSLVIYHRGQCVSALAHGTATIDKATGARTPWTPHTLALNFSTGKGVLVTLVHCLVAQGLLDYDTPIATYWADFAQNAKDTVTLRDVLSHRANLYDVQQVTKTAKDMLDWQTMVANVAAMTAQSSDTLTVAYSALVSGWILGGLVERVTELDLQTALTRYLLAPLGLVGQVYFGVPRDIVPQVAQQLRPPSANSARSKPVLQADSATTLDFYQQLPMYSDWQCLADTDAPLNTQAINALYFTPSQVAPTDYQAALVPEGSRQFNYYHPASLQAKIPAANGVASAQALATIYTMLANGGHWIVEGQMRTLITPEVFASLEQVQNNQPDKVMPATMQWRLGYHRVFSRLHTVADGFGHMGYNGSMAWCDPHRQLAVAFIHNYDTTMLNDVRQFILTEQILDFFDNVQL